MIVKVSSNIPYLQKINGEHSLQEEMTVITFLESIGVEWDEDALVVLNGKITKDNVMLQDKDKIQLLIPLSGG